MTTLMDSIPDCGAWIAALTFNNDGLIPAIVQDSTTGAVLMMAYMNEESIRSTIESGFATFFSRSRQKQWLKGETSGNKMQVLEIFHDCDGDTLLIKALPFGPACHTGTYTCFSKPLLGSTVSERGFGVLSELSAVIKDRREHPVEGSYTNYLFGKGVDKICKKIGEEAAEVIIAAKNGSGDELRYESADLIYHLMVLLENQHLTLDEILGELEKRR